MSVASYSTPGYTSQPQDQKYGISNQSYVPVTRYGSTTVVQQHTVVVGGCPSCRYYYLYILKHFKYCTPFKLYYSFGR